jgi:hypothetical protein
LSLKLGVLVGERWKMKRLKGLAKCAWRRWWRNCKRVSWRG